MLFLDCSGIRLMLAMAEFAYRMADICKYGRELPQPRRALSATLVADFNSYYHDR
jgi:hypothetical protein